MSENKSSTPGPFVTILLIIASYVLVYFLTLIIIQIIHPGWSPQKGQPHDLKWIMGFMELGLLLIPVLYLKIREYNLADIFVLKKTSINDLVWTTLFSIGIFPILDELDRLIQLIFKFKPLDKSFFEMMKYNSIVEFLILFFSIGVIASMVEEFLFRGLVFKSLEKRIGVLNSIFMSSLIWTILHGIINWTLQIFIIGVVLAILVYHLKSIWPAILLHSLNNTLSLLFINQENSDIIKYYQGTNHVKFYVLILSFILLFISSKKLFVRGHKLH